MTNRGAAAREAVGDVGARRAAVVAGMTTRPSFIAASIEIHSGATLPSISISRSPRLAPSARRPLASAVGGLRELGERQRLDARRRGSSAPALRPLSPAASSASNQSSAQLKRFGPRPVEAGAGEIVIVAQREQQIARGLEFLVDIGPVRRRSA